MKRTHKKQLTKDLILLGIGITFGVYGGAVANILHAFVYDDNFYKAFPLWVKIAYAVIVFGAFFGFLHYLNRAIERLSR